jgi:hypothetical protein
MARIVLVSNMVLNTEKKQEQVEEVEQASDTFSSLED